MNISLLRNATQLLFLFAASSLNATPIRVDIVLDLTPHEQNPVYKEYGSISYIEYDIVKPGEYLLGDDRIAGTADDILYDPNGPDAFDWSFKWELTFLHSSHNITSYLGHIPYGTHGLGYYDGGGISSWGFQPGYALESIDCYKGYYYPGSTLWFGGGSAQYATLQLYSVSMRPYTTPLPEPSSILLFCIGLTPLLHSGHRVLNSTVKRFATRLGFCD